MGNIEQKKKIFLWIFTGAVQAFIIMFFISKLDIHPVLQWILFGAILGALIFIEVKYLHFFERDEEVIERITKENGFKK